MPHNNQPNKLKAFLPTILVIVALYLLSKLIPPEQIEAVVVGAGPWGPSVYIAVSLVTYIVAPLTGTPVSFIGFHLFGSDVVFYHTVSAFLSFIINFWIARKWGRRIVKKLAGEDSLDKIDKFISDKGYVSLLVIRIFLTTYHDFISYAFGLTKIKFIPYIIISAIGLIPGYAIWLWVAQQSSSALTFTVHTFAVAGVFIGIYWVWYKYFKKNKST